MWVEYDTLGEREGSEVLPLLDYPVGSRILPLTSTLLRSPYPLPARMFIHIHSSSRLSLSLPHPQVLSHSLLLTTTSSGHLFPRLSLSLSQASSSILFRMERGDLRESEEVPSSILFLSLSLSD